MAGILDKKIKFIDLVVTREGRKQMSFGGFRPTYASFSDKEVDYDSLGKSSTETSEKLYFETPSAMSDDLIIFETDDAGHMLVAENTEKFSIVNDDVYLLTASGGSSVDYLSVTGSQFSSTIDLIKDRTLESFQRNKMIKTLSGFDLDSKVFETNINEHTFVISNSVPFPKGPLTEANDIDLSLIHI